MNAELENLVVLQAQDLELSRLRGEMAESPKRVRAAETTLSGAENALAGLRAKLAAEEKLRRAQESDIAAHRNKLDRLRRSLDSATSAQQVAAFEHEITFADTAIRTLEEDEFGSLERTELLEAEQTAAAAAVDRARSARLAETDRAASQQRLHGPAIAGLEHERANLRALISAPRLAAYDKLAKARGTAVAEAIGSATAGKCAACQMGVRPQRWQDLTGRDHRDEVFSCESCGRLLFWDPRRDAPGAWAAGERLQAALNAGPAVGRAPTGGTR